MNRTLALAAIPLLAACQQTLYLSGDGGFGSGSGGRSATTDGGNPDRSCTGSGPVAIVADAPQMVVVLDRSTNMSQSFGSQTQLNAALGALGGQIDIYASNMPSRPSISLSFLDFPDLASGCQGSNSCCAGDPKTSWSDFSQGVYYCETSSSASCASNGNRPMAAALAKADAVLTGPSSAPSYQRYVLMVTDGPPTGCAGGAPDGDCTATSNAIEALASDKINVSIVGLQSQPGTDLGCLQFSFTPSGAPIAQSVGDSMALAGALSTIMQSAVCNAHLNPGPTSSSDLTAVTYQGTNLVEDPHNGWTYDGMFARLHLHGSACQMVLAGGWNNLNVMATCPSPHSASGSSF